MGLFFAKISISIIIGKELSFLIIPFNKDKMIKSEKIPERPSPRRRPGSRHRPDEPRIESGAGVGNHPAVGGTGFRLSPE
jgi:hypothetical protein